MADFCKQCSIRIFGEDFHDLAGLITEEQYKEGITAQVLCEGCGFVSVNHLGEDVSGNAGENKHDRHA